jgi:hypothetical protein
LKPIADDLLSIYSNAEQFANGALMIVHQIPYREIGPEKYPVETIVENEGDCDLFSFIAASIMMAGGLDTVLLFYETQNHMNVGVNLPENPKETRSGLYYFTHDEKRYYIAECTGGDGRNGWRVGECPDTLRGETAQIITLDGYEASAPSQVSSSWDALALSSLSLEASARFGVVGRVTVSGFISPTLPGENVTVYASSWGSPFNVVSRVVTDDDGRFSYTWRPPSVGLLFIVASWSGDVSYAGADSNVCSLIVVPYEWLMMSGMVIASLIVLLIVRSATRKRTQIPESLEEGESE